MASKSVIKRMDYIFKRYCRLRDTSNGVFRCCSCGQYKNYSLADGGHFINCRWMSTRWEETNVHAQCSSCNRFDEGNSAGYAMFMIKKYGQKHVDYLLALKNEPALWSDFELELLIKEYKTKVKALEKNKF